MLHLHADFSSSWMYTIITHECLFYVNNKTIDDSQENFNEYDISVI